MQKPIPYDQARLHAAAEALQKDLLMRAEIDEDSREIVNVSNGVWQEFCAALEETDENHSRAIHEAEQS